MNGEGTTYSFGNDSKLRMPLSILGNQLQLFSIPKIDLFTYSKHSDIIKSFIFPGSIGIFKIKIKTDCSKRTS